MIFAEFAVPKYGENRGGYSLLFSAGPLARDMRRPRELWTRWTEGGLTGGMRRFEFMAFAGGDLRTVFSAEIGGEWAPLRPPISAAAGGNAGADSGHSRQFSAAFPGLLRTSGGRRLPAALPSRRDGRCRPETGQIARALRCLFGIDLETASRRADSGPEHPADCGTQIAFL